MSQSPQGKPRSNVRFQKLPFPFVPTDYFSGKSQTIVKSREYHADCKNILFQLLIIMVPAWLYKAYGGTSPYESVEKRHGSDAAWRNGGILEIGAKRQDRDVVVSIKDEGKGMTQIQLEQVGAPFYSTQEKGNGPGLMVRCRIVETIGGT